MKIWIIYFILRVAFWTPRHTDCGTVVVVVVVVVVEREEEIQAFD